jgi:hypothetical protein
MPLLWLAVLLMTLFSRPARADDSAAADEAFERGVEAFHQDRYEEALVDFQRAYDLAPHPLVLYNLAATYRELGRYGDAIVTYQRFLAEGEGGGEVEPELFTRARRELAELRARQAEADWPRMGDLQPPDVPVAAEVAPAVHATVARTRHWGFVAAGITNALYVDGTGTATLGVRLRLSSRVSFGLDVVTRAWSVMPSMRLRLAGDRLAGYAVLAAPVALTGASGFDPFVAGAIGVGVRWRATPRIAVFTDALVSVATGGHGATVPVLIGVEWWF